MSDEPTAWPPTTMSEPFAWPDRLGDRWERRYGETTLFLATEGGE